MLKSINWTQDKGLEHLLKEGKCEWEVQEVRLNDVNLDESKKRQSRLDRQLDEDRVLSIAVAMEEGVPVPMICLYKVRGIGFMDLAGLHRGFAAKTYVSDRDNSFKVKAYVITAGDPKFILEELPSLTNAIEGVGLTMDQRRLRAAELVMSEGYPIEEVAKRFGLRAPSLADHVAGVALKDRLAGMGIQIAKSLTKNTVIKALRGIQHNDMLLKATGQFLSQHDLTQEQTARLVSNIKSGRTEQSGLLEVAKAAQERNGTAERVWTKTPRRTTILRAFSQLLSLLKKHKTLESLQFSAPEDQQLFETQAHEVVTLLANLKKGVHA